MNRRHTKAGTSFYLEAARNENGEKAEPGYFYDQQMLTDEEDDTLNRKKDLNAFTAKLRERRDARRLSEY